MVGATVLCEKCSDPHRSEYPGVGFDLTLDYGTSAVYFPNHSVVSIAKIEGSQRYKSLMRNLAKGQDSPHSLRKGWVSMCLESIKPVIPQVVSKELEKWQIPTTPPINAMLLALRTATETYLETPLNTTDLVTSIVLSKSNRHLLELELNRLGLRRTEGGFYFALKAAVLPNDRTRDHAYFSDNDEIRLILAVDYSRSALTTALFSDDNGVLETHRFLQDVDIGADASPSHLPWNKELGLKRRRLLREVASLPVTDAGFELPGTISELVLIGDRAKDDELLELLEEIVGTGLVARLRNTTQYDSVDPVFTAVEGSAARGKYRIDEGGESCLSWDCKRSWINHFGF